MKVGDLVEVGAQGGRKNMRNPMYALIVGFDTRGWIRIRFIDDEYNGDWDHLCYPKGTLRLISEA
jgi:hypothetical protein